jgi:hypothetical protein
MLIRNEREVTCNQTTNVAMHTTVIKICYLSISQLILENMYGRTKLAAKVLN